MPSAVHCAVTLPGQAGGPGVRSDGRELRRADGRAVDSPPAGLRRPLAVRGDMGGVTRLGVRPAQGVRASGPALAEWVVLAREARSLKYPSAVAGLNHGN